MAELAAAFRCADQEITPEVREDHAAYIGHWLEIVSEDDLAIFSAAAPAQRASDYLHSLQPVESKAAVWAASGQVRPAVVGRGARMRR